MNRKPVKPRFQRFERPGQAKPGDVMHVNVQLQGPEEIDPFLQFKLDEFLRNNSEAGRKLILGKLAERKTSPATL